MAAVNTAVTTVRRLFPFQGLDELPRERSDVPRSQLIFDARGFAIPGASTGNNQTISIGMSLPVNFSYALVDFYLGIFGDTALATNNFENRATININNSASGVGREYTILDSAFSDGEQGFTANMLKTYQMRQYPRLLIQAPPGEGGGLTVNLVNFTDDDQDYTLSVMCRFLVYDVTQTYHYQTNSPTLTR